MFCQRFKCSCLLHDLIKVCKGNEDDVICLYTQQQRDVKETFRNNSKNTTTHYGQPILKSHHQGKIKAGIKNQDSLFASSTDDQQLLFKEESPAVFAGSNRYPSRRVMSFSVMSILM